MAPQDSSRLKFIFLEALPFRDVTDNTNFRQPVLFRIPAEWDGGHLAIGPRRPSEGPRANLGVLKDSQLTSQPVRSSSPRRF